MVVQASVKTPIFFKQHTACTKNTWNSEVRKPVSYKDSGDDDDVPLSARLSQMSNFGTCSSECDDSVKKMHTTLPFKRTLDNSNSLQISVKKSKVSVSLYDDDDNGDIPISWRIKRSCISADNSIPVMKKFMEKELALVEKSIEGCQKKKQVEEQRLYSLKRDIDKCSKEFGTKKMQVSCDKKVNELHEKMQSKIEECVKDLVAKEAQLYLMEDLIGECKQELKTKEIELHQVNDNNDKDRERKEEELKILSQKIAECTKELKTKVNKLDAMKKLINGQAKELESERKKLLKVMSIRRTDPRAQMKDFESMKKQFEGQVKELESKEKQCEGLVKELESKEKHFEERVKELESKEKQLESQVKVFKSKRKHFKSRAKKLESKEKQFEGRVRELESKEKKHEGRVKEFQSREEEFEGRVKELKSQKKLFESRVEEFKSKEEQLEGRAKELESKENKFEVQTKELISKEQFELQMKSKANKFDRHLKDFELREKQYEALLKSFEEDKELGNQLSATIDGRSLQLLSSDQMDERESLGNDILVELLASSDPSKVVLDIIQNPIIPQCRNGDSAVNIDGSHIVVLEQLMRISPAIKPHVREEALKLALDLKANMSENTENSLGVLGFLLLLSIYGLVPSFDEDEVFKLFGYSVQHKIAVELFKTLGFGDKISDLVQNLVGKQQYFEAVRFICAYYLVDKYQIVDLL